MFLWKKSLRILALLFLLYQPFTNVLLGILLCIVTTISLTTIFQLKEFAITSRYGFLVVGIMICAVYAIGFDIFAKTEFSTIFITLLTYTAIGIYIVFFLISESRYTLNKTEYDHLGDRYEYRSQGHMINIAPFLVMLTHPIMTLSLHIAIIFTLVILYGLEIYKWSTERKSLYVRYAGKHSFMSAAARNIHKTTNASY